MSGSMRRDDVNGARCRSDAVFTVICRDYIAKQLTGKGKALLSAMDVVSIILMNETCRTVFEGRTLD